MSDITEVLEFGGMEEQKVQRLCYQITSLDCDPDASAEAALQSLQKRGVTFSDLYELLANNSKRPISGKDLIKELVRLYQDKRAELSHKCKKRKLSNEFVPSDALADESGKRARQQDLENLATTPNKQDCPIVQPRFDIISAVIDCLLVDVFEEVFSFLDAPTIACCEMVTKKWCTNIHTTNVWKRHYQVMMRDPFIRFLVEKLGWEERLPEIENQSNSYESPGHLVDAYAQICLELSSLDKENKERWRNGRPTFKMVRSHTDDKRGVLCLCADKKHVLAGLRDSRVKVFDRESRRCILILEGHEEEISAIVANEQHVLCGTVDGVMQVWCRQTGSLVVSKAAHGAAISSLSLGSGVLVAGSRDKTVSVWDWDPLQDDPLSEKFVIAEHKALVTCVCVDDKNIFTASEDSSVKMWGLSTGTMLFSFHGHNEEVTSIDVSENFLVSGGTDAIILWDISTGRQLRRISANVGVTCVAINARHIITGDEKGCLQIFDARLALDPNTPDKNVCLQRLPMHHGRVFAVELSFEGFISCAKDGFILIASYS